MSLSPAVFLSQESEDLMPDCQFKINPASASLRKKGDVMHFTMDPPNTDPCSVSCSTRGEVEIVQCGGDGSATVRATADNARGYLYITKRCPNCGPTPVDVRIGSVVLPEIPDDVLPWAIIGNAVITGLTGGLIGFLFGGLPGALIGGSVGVLVGAADKPILIKILRAFGRL
jgi:hypothetical protein